MRFIKKYWFVAVFIFGLGSWVTVVELTSAAQDEKIEANDKKIDKTNETIKQIAENQARLVNLQEQMKGQLDMIIRLLGITVTDSAIQRWRKVPKSLPLDPFGNPIIGAEWLSVSPDYLLGRTFKWIHNDSLLVRTEWDEREHINR